MSKNIIINSVCRYHHYYYYYLCVFECVFLFVPPPFIPSTLPASRVRRMYCKCIYKYIGTPFTHTHFTHTHTPLTLEEASGDNYRNAPKRFNFCRFRGKNLYCATIRLCNLTFHTSPVIHYTFSSVRW